MKARTSISIRGKWVEVPSLQFDEKTLILTGGWLKTASVHDETWSENEIGDPELCVRQLKENKEGVRADVFTFTQKPNCTAIKADYPVHRESIAAACFTSYKEWWESLPQETRKNVRRSQKRGVTIEVKQFDDDLIRSIMELNNESPMRQGKPFTHYGKSFEQVKHDYSAFIGRCDFMCAYFEGEIIGLCQIVYRGDVASLIQLIVKGAHSDKRPSNALLAKAFELCDARGIKCFTYGNFNYGNKGNTPLREFKTRHGFNEVLVPRYYVPLTVWGSLCVKLGIQRGLLGILPESAIVTANKARERWYRLKAATKPV
jgi:hypothetical protein